jgi:hypothetical protein
MAGIPAKILGVQSRGCLISVPDMLTHLASLAGASKRTLRQICRESGPAFPSSPGRGRAVVKYVARSLKVQVHRLTLSKCLLRSDLAPAEMLAFFQSLCRHLSMLSQVPLCVAVLVYALVYVFCLARGGERSWRTECCGAH